MQVFCQFLPSWQVIIDHNVCPMCFTDERNIGSVVGDDIEVCELIKQLVFQNA